VKLCVIAACRVVIAAASLAFVLLPVQAQTSPAKQPPRLSPNTSQTNQIPAGVDTGSPTTSDAMPLGTPVPPAAGVGSADQRTRSAAARAAARPDPRTRTGAPLPDETLVTPGVARDAARVPGATAGRLSSARPACASQDDRAFRASMAQCAGLADRAERSSCAARATQARDSGGDAVALPGSGFTGSSAAPRTAAALARGSGRADCD